MAALAALTVVRLQTDEYRDKGVARDAIGTILDVYDDAYEVEFSREDGTTIGWFPVRREDVEPAAWGQTTTSARRVNPIIERYLDAIKALAREYGVQRLDLFGSAATDRFNEATSDFDFIVTFADTTMPGYLDRRLAFADALEAVLGRPVVLITERSIRSPYFRQAVEDSRQLLYDDRDASTAAWRIAILPDDSSLCRET